MMESAACPQNKEQERKVRRVIITPWIMSVTTAARSSRGIVNNDNCCEQKRPFIQQSVTSAGGIRLR